MVSLPVWVVNPIPPAHPEVDPVMDAILNAPLAEMPETDEERAAFDAVIAELGAGARGRFAGPEAVTAVIAEMRAEQGE